MPGDVLVSMRMSSKLKLALDRYCTELNMSRQEASGQAIEAWLRKPENDALDLFRPAEEVAAPPAKTPEQAAQAAIEYIRARGELGGCR